MTYEINLITQLGAVLSVPVLPDKMQIKSPGKDMRTEVLGLGEVVLPRLRGLRSIAWDSFLPVRNAPYVTGTLTHTPIDFVRALQNIRDSLQPLRFQLLGTDLDINVDMLISNLSYEERGLEPGDLYYSIELTEWKECRARLLDLGATQEDSTAPRGSTPSTPKSYTVRKGDSLWAIAKRTYNDGARWKDIYNANQSVVGQNSNLIFPGQVLTLP